MSTPRPDLPHTSIEAFHKSAPIRISHKNLIADALAKAENGLTAEECSAALNSRLDPVQVNRAMKDLEEDGIAERFVIGTNRRSSPIYESRTNRKGNKMCIWYRIKEAFPYG